MAQPTILIKGTNWLGDVIISLPAIAYLAQQNPNSDIYILSKKNVAGVYSFAPYIKGVIEYDMGKGVKQYVWEIARLRKILTAYHFSKAYVFPNSFSSALLSRLSEAKHIFGYAKNLRSFMLTDIVAKKPLKKHQVFFYLNIAGYQEISFTNESLLQVSKKEQDQIQEQCLPQLNKTQDVLIGVAPGAAFGGAKRLPVLKYIEIIKGIAKNNPKTKFVLMGTAADKVYCDKIYDSLTELFPQRLYNRAGETSLQQATVISSLCKIFLSNDSGLMHLACVLGATTIAFFGPTVEEHTSPLGRFEIIRSSEQIDCVPCMKRECMRNNHRCMESIDTAEVVTKVNGLLS